eukprot:g7535.t1
MIQKQKDDLQAEVEYYETLSKTQKGDAASLKTEFDQTCLELQEEITEKEKERQRAEEFKIQLAARDAKLAEFERRLEELTVDNPENFLSSFNKVRKDNVNDPRQFIEGTIETNSKDEPNLVELKKTLLSLDNQEKNEMKNISLTMPREQTESSEATSKSKAHLGVSYHESKDKASSFETKVAQRESTCADEVFQIEQVSENQTLQLEDSMRCHKQLASDRQTVIEGSVNQIQEIKPEEDKNVSEVNCGETEDRAVIKNVKDIIRRLKRQLKCSKRKIAALKVQLNAREEGSGSFHLADINSITNRPSDHDCTYFRALKSIGNILNGTGVKCLALP